MSGDTCVYRVFTCMYTSVHMYVYVNESVYGCAIRVNGYAYAEGLFSDRISTEPKLESRSWIEVYIR